ncbi:hypothetical protein K458DRAFT_91167 [Lentithecium fluviatile CBS 122367]|uniref:Uncharacterized protein n=1 Tax=Lentithecium fluviatile CBS 122367 TaxID=1168545 RepID=A0A6G1IRC3_9PLEO|nr:hypothetical protein K458DRAFT_91167 [Lentithecium fluviatile CBS 122367]
MFVSAATVHQRWISLSQKQVCGALWKRWNSVGRIVACWILLLPFFPRLGVATYDGIWTATGWMRGRDPDGRAWAYLYFHPFGESRCSGMTARF